MLTITFKNVGHGDTIFLEWKNDSGENEIGIIDCNAKDGDINLAIDHIFIHRYKKVKFMILSHPHTDHFSGFSSLLEFCKNNHIQIERFWHTAAYNSAFIGELLDKITTDDFFDSFVNRKNDKNSLKALFGKIHRLHGSPTLKEAGIATNSSWLPLNRKLCLEFLSPSAYDESSKYCNQVFQQYPEEEFKLKKRRNNPAANLLSSVIKIKTDAWHALLTSDSTHYTIKRLYNYCFDQLDSKLVVMQIPHHGSNQSQYDDFWLKIPNKKQVPTFVSVGEEYGLPNKEVVEFFDKNYEEVHSTNFVGGFKEYFETKQFKENEIKNQDISSKFYLYDNQFLSHKISQKDINNGCGEKKIKIEENGMLSILTKSIF